MSPYRFVRADALTIKVREGGRTVIAHGLITVGVNADGHRELLGFDVASAKDGAGWLAFFHSLVARGLTGIVLVTSDAHRARCGHPRHQLARNPDATTFMRQAHVYGVRA